MKKYKKNSKTASIIDFTLAVVGISVVIAVFKLNNFADYIFLMSWGILLIMGFFGLTGLYKVKTDGENLFYKSPLLKFASKIDKSDITVKNFLFFTMYHFKVNNKNFIVPNNFVDNSIKQYIIS